MKPQGFPKDERLRKSDDFTRVLREGKRVRGRLVDARWCDGETHGELPNRVGIVAGRRIGNAVLRNRLKRRLREAYRRNKGELPSRGVALVLLATARLVGRAAAEVEEDLRRLLQEIAARTAP